MNKNIIPVCLVSVSVCAGNLLNQSAYAEDYSSEAYYDQSQNGEMTEPYYEENGTYTEDNSFVAQETPESYMENGIGTEPLESTAPETGGDNFEGYTEEYSANWNEEQIEGERNPEINSSGLEKKPFDEEVFLVRKSRTENFIEDFDIKKKEDAEKVFDLQAYEDIPVFRYLDVPEIMQLPELPTGCESVSLTMALNYEGFDLEKTTIAREFMIYNNETDNMAVGYIGDPFSEEGAGCFAPAIAATAESFFVDQGYDYTAYDISGTEFEELLSYVAAGTPVVVWTTMYMAEPEFTEEHGEYDGVEYQWYRQEHCVVLSGYDKEEQILQINDPLEGIVTRDLSEFEEIYNATGKCAVVVKEREPEDGSADKTTQETDTQGEKTVTKPTPAVRN